MKLYANDLVYWQFKNGSMGPRRFFECMLIHETFPVGCYFSWDRSLGAWVAYV